MSYYQVINTDLVPPNWRHRDDPNATPEGCLGVIVSTHFTLAKAIKAQAKYRRGMLNGHKSIFQIYQTPWFKPYCSSYLYERYNHGYRPCKINLWEI